MKKFDNTALKSHKMDKIGRLRPSDTYEDFFKDQKHHFEIFQGTTDKVYPKRDLIRSRIVARPPGPYSAPRNWVGPK